MRSQNNSISNFNAHVTFISKPRFINSSDFEWNDLHGLETRQRQALQHTRPIFTLYDRSHCQVTNIDAFLSLICFILKICPTKYRAFDNIIPNRTLIMSRHAFLGSGKHSAKWTGEYDAQWDDFRRSVIATVEMNMFGFSLVNIYLALDFRIKSAKRNKKCNF